MQNTILESKVNTSACYQCYTCSLGCPMSTTMDMLPHQAVRMVQLGREAEVIQSNIIWQCINCEACATRCPRGIDIPRIMDSLRHEYIRNKIKPKTNIPGYHKVFMDGIRQNGIQFELGMLIRLKLATMDFFSDLGLGMRMMLKRKLNFYPHRTKELSEIRHIFQKTTERS